jgi:CheY-like chemotaxis protein
MKTILLVENDPIATDRVRRELAGHYHILETPSPVEALDICRNHLEIDLLICDAELGLVSGMELASLLRSWISRLQTILISDLPCDSWDERQETELHELPSDGVLILEKPFTSLQLKSAIRKLVGEEFAVAKAFGD